MRFLLRYKHVDLDDVPLAISGAAGCNRLANL
jgi:hypothetical protein